MEPLQRKHILSELCTFDQMLIYTSDCVNTTIFIQSFVGSTLSIELCITIIMHAIVCTGRILALSQYLEKSLAC